MTQDFQFMVCFPFQNYPNFYHRVISKPNAKAFMSQISSHMITPAAVPIGSCDLRLSNRSQAL